MTSSASLYEHEAVKEVSYKAILIIYFFLVLHYYFAKVLDIDKHFIHIHFEHISHIGPHKGREDRGGGGGGKPS